MNKKTIYIKPDGSIDGYMTQKQAAEKLNVNISTIRTWIHRGQLPILKVGNTTYIEETAKKPHGRDMPVSKKVVANIKVYCKDHGIAISDFERSIGLSQGYISRCANGKKALSIDAVCLMADYLQIPIVRLITFPIEYKPYEGDHLCKQEIQKAINGNERDDVFFADEKNTAQSPVASESN